MMMHTEQRLPTDRRHWAPEGESSGARAPKIPRVEITGHLGDVPAGAVWRALERESDREVLVFVRHQVADSEMGPDCFAQAAAAIVEVHHPNILDHLGMGVSQDGHCYFLLEDTRGGTLWQYLEERGPLLCQRALDIVERLADALAVAHRHELAHGDLRPENVLLVHHPGAPDGAFPFLPKLMGFRLFKETDGDPQTHSPAAAAGYKAPEQLDGAPPDERSEIYGLGALLLTMLTGHRPYLGSVSEISQAKHHEQPPNARHLSSTVPGRLSEFIRELMDPDPLKRPQRLEDLAQQVRMIKDRTDTNILTKQKREKGTYRLVAFAAALVFIVVAEYSFLYTFGAQTGDSFEYSRENMDLPDNDTYLDASQVEDKDEIWKIEPQTERRWAPLTEHRYSQAEMDAVTPDDQDALSWQHNSHAADHFGAYNPGYVDRPEGSSLKNNPYTLHLTTRDGAAEEVRSPQVMAEKRRQEDESVTQ